MPVFVLEPKHCFPHNFQCSHGCGRHIGFPIKVDFVGPPHHLLQKAFLVFGLILYNLNDRFKLIKPSKCLVQSSIYARYPDGVKYPCIFASMLTNEKKKKPTTKASIFKSFRSIRTNSTGTCLTPNCAEPEQHGPVMSAGAHARTRCWQLTSESLRLCRGAISGF